MIHIQVGYHVITIMEGLQGKILKIQGGRGNRVTVQVPLFCEVCCQSQRE